jgi:hypothetical protein
MAFYALEILILYASKKTIGNHSHLPGTSKRAAPECWLSLKYPAHILQNLTGSRCSILVPFSRGLGIKK